MLFILFPALAFLNLDKDDPYIEENALIIEEILKQRIEGIKNEKGVYECFSYFFRLLRRYFPRCLISTDCPPYWLPATDILYTAIPDRWCVRPIRQMIRL